MPEKKNEAIELRSEKVRNIVGKVPPLLLRMGISVISVIIVLMLTLAYLIPYPEYKDISVTIIPDTLSEIYGVCLIPRDEIGRVSEGQKVSVTIEDDFDRKNFLINGYICKIYPFVDSDDATGKIVYNVEISGFPDSLRRCTDKWFLFPNEKHNGKILLSDKPVLKKILGIN